ncbi:MAG: acyltransferase family protein [Actinobacteria bacterium]|nr:acyltransferase family protein [Actinomycetota bacterium]
MAIAEVDRPIDLEPLHRDAGPVVETKGAEQPSSGGYLPYFPALDGLRGLAVISVLFFHAGFSWAVGGYLGVSTFFTLSGFLITSLILAESNATGHVDLRLFWTRRFRRLMPAALAAMALAVLVAFFGDPVARSNIGGDIWSGLTYVANWRFVLSGKSYAELFSAPSPIQHFWSLAIEEQFYLLYPLLAFAVLRVSRNSRAIFGAILAALTAASIILPIVWGYSKDRLYYGTDARAAELLIGALLAVILYYRPFTDRLAGSRRVQVAMAAAGAGALTISVGLWATISQQSDPLYLGGFFAYSLLTVLVIISTLLPIGPVASLLSTAPMRWMGKISYGVYLYHWPIYLAVNEERVPLSGFELFIVRVALTLAVSIVSYRYLETPIRQGQPLRARGWRIRPVRFAPVAITVLGITALVVGLTAPPPVIDFELAQQQLKFSDAPPPAFDPNSTTPPRPRIAMFGDSTALETAFGLNQFLTMSGKGDLVGGVTELGCSLIRGGYLMDYNGVGKNQEKCNRWDQTFKEELDAKKPNIAIVQDGPWEVISHQFAEEPGKWYTIGEPRFDDYLTKEMTAVIDLLSANGAAVYWMTLPRIGAPKGQDARRLRGEAADPARAKRFNEIVRTLPTLRPGKVRVLDLAGWLEQSGEDQRLRPDGVHFSPETAREVSERFLADTVINQFNDDWVAAKRAEFQAKQAGQMAPVRTLVVGDSAALGLGLGMGKYAEQTKAMNVGSVAQIGCGIGRGGSRKNKDLTEAVPKECQTWETDWPKAIQQDKPDVLVVLDNLWDTTDRQLDGDKTWRAPGDPKYDAYLTGEFSRAADVLHMNGQPVVWLTAPPIDLGRTDNPNKSYPVEKPERMQRVNEIIREVAKTRPWMVVADYAEYAKTWPGGSIDSRMRPDGIHLTGETGAIVTKDWLAPILFDVVRNYRNALAAATGTEPVAVPEPLN